MRVYSGRDLLEGVEQQFVITAVGGVLTSASRGAFPAPVMTSEEPTTLKAELNLLLQSPLGFYNEVISRSGKASW